MLLSELRAKYQKLAVVAGAVIVFDQITKAVILNNLPLYNSVAVIPGLFSLTHIHNPGGAFGFLASQSSNVRNTIFILIATLAVGLIFYFYRQTPKTHPLLASGFALIFGGALGNLIDRLRFGKVVDFLDFYIGNYHWPAFNVADSAISVGVTIFLFHIIFKNLPE
ncbi:MAG: signal peptidase II [Pseudomonadota bacterium]|uniref:Lipoprotein signal peptidase n=1 Tax=Candidatus Desulfatibia profunda TaxID=2841695 RepID=A0A8J6NUN1_9BACT|nr:signal peptidase II [Candidatus Desulfatibia profunda]MBL7178734.1 signal peptidase II [Desulfobacterales bacterium]